jgi:hypothetical protein
MDKTRAVQSQRVQMLHHSNTPFPRSIRPSPNSTFDTRPSKFDKISSPGTPGTPPLLDNPSVWCESPPELGAPRKLTRKEKMMIAPSTGARLWPKEQPRLCRPRAFTRRSAAPKPDASRKFRVSAAHRSPGGTSDNSPAFQRRERDAEVSSPEGTVDSSSGKLGKTTDPARRSRSRSALTPPPAIRLNQA